MNNDEQTRQLEFISFQSWLPREVEEYGEWYLRYNDGVTRRANSVFPHGHPKELPLESAIAHAINFYSERNVPVRFQMTNSSLPENLDRVLEEEGFARRFPVSVQVARLDEIPKTDISIETEVFDKPNAAWMAAYQQGSGYPVESMDVRRSLMMRSPLPKTFGAAELDGKIVAVGLAVVKDAWCGLFNIATTLEHRRSGAGTAVSLALLSWAGKYEASNAYLQVEIDNMPAIRMYEKLGFKTLYRYWYRVQGEKLGRKASSC